jgi:ATP-dependent helicase/nuclease subunit A
VIADQEARQAITEKLSSCLLVEAGAGSGKTSSLVQRMLVLIGRGYCKIENIAAVTFTRKAAAELQERFQVALERALASKAEPETKKRWEEALIDINRCFIGTIHSFCGLLLRERPVEAGIAPDFREIDDSEDRAMREQAWHDYVHHLNLEPEKLKRLHDVDITLADLRSMFDVICTYPDVEFARQGNCPPPELTTARLELYELLSSAQSAMPEREPQKGWDNLQRILGSALRWQRIHDLNKNINLLRLFTIMNRKGSVILNRWIDRDTAKYMRDRFEWFKINYIEPALEEWWNYRYDICLDYLLEGAGYYEVWRKTLGVVNFQDLLMKTAALLRDNPEVRRYFQDRYRCILIDEFQDTDPIQAQIMFYLAGKENKEKDWRKITPRKGSLFVVGDPKQSIYRFRRAEIDIYYEVKQRFEVTGGRILYLTSNFRSLQSIGEWANPLFQEHFPPETTTCQAGFKGLEMIRENEKGCDGGVRVLQISLEGRHNKTDIVRQDARIIAAWIARAIKKGKKLARTREEIESGNTGPVRPDDFMILLRYKEDMDTYAAALEEKGIPYLITGGQGLSSSQELKDLLLILQALQDPTDPVKLLAALRGFYFGISDNDLYQFKKAGGVFHFQKAVPEELQPGIKSRLEESFNRLRCYRKWFNNLPPRTAVEKVIIDNGLIPASMLKQSNKAAAAFVVQFLELLEKEGINSLAALIEFLQKLLDMGVEEEISLHGGNEKAVRLMNLHKAKGLEAPVVILANPAKIVNGRIRFHIDRKTDVPRGYLQLTRPKGSYGSEILARPQKWEEYEEAEKEYNEAEELRLLYVAATRAKNLLLISTYPQKPGKNPWSLLIPNLPACTFLNGTNLDEIPALKVLKEIDLPEDELRQDRDKFPFPGSAEHIPSYTIKPVTSFKNMVSEPRRTAGGKGVSWGNVIHRLLETCVRQEPVNPETTITRILEQEGRDPAEAGEILSLLQEIQETRFWKRVMNSSLKMSEVPLAGFLPKDENSDQPESFVTGIIDLIFQEPSGWVIADYKTDYIEDEEHLRELTDYYAPQVKLYRQLWEQLGGGKVAECGLFFVSGMRWVRIA